MMKLKLSNLLETIRRATEQMKSVTIGTFTIFLVVYQKFLSLMSGCKLTGWLPSCGIVVSLSLHPFQWHTTRKILLHMSS